MLLIPVIMGTIMYYKVIGTFEDEISSSNISMLTQFRETVDSRLNELNQMAMQISLNPEVQNYLSKRLPLNEQDSYEACKLTKDLSTIMNSRSFADDFYIYYDNCKSVFTYNGRYTSRFFYDNFYSYVGISFNEWIHMLNSKSYFRHYMLSKTILCDNKNEKNFITYIQTIPIGDRVSHSSAVVILINDNKFKNMFDGISEQSMAFILDSNMDIVVAKDNEKPNRGLIPDYNLLKGSKGLTEINVNRARYIVNYVSSLQNDWKYVVVTPQSVFMKKAYEIKYFILQISAINIFIGLVMAFFLAFKSYKPIKILNGLLYNWIPSDKNKKSNEFGMINEAINGLKQENIRLHEEGTQINIENKKILEYTKKNAPLVRNMLLANVLKGNIDDYSIINGTLKDYGTVLDGMYYAVILLMLGSISNKYDIHDTAQKNNLEKDAVFKFINHIESRINRYVTFELDHNVVAVIIQASNDIGNDRMKNEIADVSGSIVKFLYENFKTTVTMAVGKIYKGIENISMSYADAIRALDYKIIKEDCTIISYDDIVETGKDYYYPIELELKLINMVETGDMLGIDELLSELFDDTLQLKKVPLNLARCLFFDIVATTLKILNKIKIDYKSIFSEDYDPVGKLLNCKTITEMRSEMKSIFERICNYINNSNETGSKILVNRAENYIGKHYMDESVCQTSIAEALGVTSGYLSRTFKQYTGQNMVDYISKLRVEGAKVLLNDEKLTLNAIAERVGCGSDISLIRIFRKYMGVTPGKYRESIT
jgi:AraC-type DNA-binding domain-containing proteins